jgi:diadenosine tetraphosphate (Ap4A) HIT family hydrolase
MNPPQASKKRIGQPLSAQARSATGGRDGAALPACELCASAGGTLVWRDRKCRVVLVDDADYRGYCRVVWNKHVKEMTDLPPGDQAHCMRVVFMVERVLRDLLEPHKVNVACLGNMTPHIHWHVIPRFKDDAHFPLPIWGRRQRASAARRGSGAAAAFATALAARLAARSA